MMQGGGKLKSICGGSGIKDGGVCGWRKMEGMGIQDASPPHQMHKTYKYFQPPGGGLPTRRVHPPRASHKVEGGDYYHMQSS